MTAAFFVHLIFSSCLVMAASPMDPGDNGLTAARPSQSRWNTRRLPDIYWNTTNPIFRIDNTDHIIDVNKGRGRSIFDYDQVNIICPMYPKNASLDRPIERFIIYAVNKEEFDTCRIMTPHPRIIAACDTPFQYKFFTITFRSFSPTPGQLEFRPGQDYYFISTSSVEDLHQRVDGMCRDNNMRIVFKVADPSKEDVREKKPPKSQIDRNDIVIAMTTARSPPLLITTTTQRQLSNAVNYWFDSTPYEILEASVKGDNLSQNNDDIDAESSFDWKLKNKRRWKKHRRRMMNLKEQRDAYSILDDEKNASVIAQKKPSFVEKVNNLMKQEASISSSTQVMSTMVTFTPATLLLLITFL